MKRSGKGVFDRLAEPQVLTVVPTPVPENLGIFGTRGIATFEFSFELERWSGGGPGIRYVVSDDNGWLTIRAEDKKGDFSLPHLAKVQVTRVGEDREYLTVLEGAFKGRKGSVSFRNGVSSLSPAPPIREQPSNWSTIENRASLTCRGWGRLM